jgi:glycosyltransferase involved in cell wall biosynthesis
MTPFFSIIVPCCDVEPYIEECLRSLLGQSFQNWECLIGVETSTDRTEEIIREMTAGDSRFRIFTGPRTGSCSASRNTGTDMAQGEYVIFLDGDDTIADGCLERLHEKICANPGADLYPCAIAVKHDEISGTDEIRDNYRPDAPAEMTGAEATLYLERNWCGAFCPMLQLSVHRRVFLVENDLKCIRGLRHQDSEFSPRALYRAKRVVPLHEPFYNYRIRMNSVQTMAKGADYFLKDWTIITKSLLAFYGKVSKEEGFDRRVVPCWIRQWLSRMNRMWFLPGPVRDIPRSKRAESLEMIFADGFDVHRNMLKYGSRAQRIAGFWVRAFVKHPSMRWVSELFFRFYFHLTRDNDPDDRRTGFRRAALLTKTCKIVLSRKH